MKALQIKERRKKLGLTQGKLAEMLGVSENTVYNYEKGTTIPQSKIAILRKILWPEVTSIALKSPEVLLAEADLKDKNAAITHNKLLLEQVNTSIEVLQASKVKNINVLTELKNALDLKYKIQLDLEVLLKNQTLEDVITAKVIKKISDTNYSNDILKRLDVLEKLIPLMKQQKQTTQATQNDLLNIFRMVTDLKREIENLKPHRLRNES